MNERVASLEVFKRTTQVDGKPVKRFYWRLRAGNGLIVADGAEGYTRRGDAVKAADRAKELMAVAAVEVIG